MITYISSTLILQPVASVIDFGLAERFGKYRIGGTDGYIAPEHYYDYAPTCSKTDVFGLGITLMEMLSPRHCNEVYFFERDLHEDRFEAYDVYASYYARNAARANVACWQLGHDAEALVARLAHQMIRVSAVLGINDLFILFCYVYFEEFLLLGKILIGVCNLR